MQQRRLHEADLRRAGGRLTARYQRWSVPLAGLLSQVALEVAGRAGTRLARALGIAVHRGTLLRLMIDLPEPAISSAPEVLGVDLSRARDYPDMWLPRGPGTRAGLGSPGWLAGCGSG